MPCYGYGYGYGREDDVGFSARRELIRCPGDGRRLLKTSRNIKNMSPGTSPGMSTELSTRLSSEMSLESSDATSVVTEDVTRAFNGLFTGDFILESGGITVYYDY